jgi:hypothetical protein
MRLLIVASTCICLVGCATPYQEMGILGGVKATRITEDTAQITATGNALVDVDTIQQYALRRAAEETVNDGFDLFRIVGDADRTSSGYETGSFSTGNRRGAWGFGYSMPVVKPGQTITIRMLKGPRPDPMPDGEFDAREVLKFLGQAGASSQHRNCAKQPDGSMKCE